MAQIKYNLGDLGKEVYSTEEIAIGTWIDGKTIYRKVLLCTKDVTVSTSSGWTIVQGWSDEISKLNIKDYVSIDFSSISNGDRIDYIIRNDKHLEFYCLYASIEIEKGNPMIIEYTKTTDA